MACKGKYCTEVVDQIAQMVSEAVYPVVEICAKVDIAESTYYEWMENKPEFSEAIKKAKKKALGNLGEMAKKALVKKLQGYDYEETVIEKIPDKDGKLANKVVKRTVKHVPPSDTAIIFTLKNAENENYRDKHELDVTDTTPPKDVESMKQEIAKMVSALGINFTQCKEIEVPE